MVFNPQAMQQSQPGVAMQPVMGPGQGPGGQGPGGQVQAVAMGAFPKFGAQAIPMMMPAGQFPPQGMQGVQGMPGFVPQGPGGQQPPGGQGQMMPQQMFHRGMGGGPGQHQMPSDYG